MHSSVHKQLPDDIYHFNSTAAFNITAHAPEWIILGDGRIYITSCGWGKGGVFLSQFWLDSEQD